MPSDVLRLSPHHLPAGHSRQRRFCAGGAANDVGGSVRLRRGPLPPSFQAMSSAGIELLPSTTIVTQPEASQFRTEMAPDSDAADEGTDILSATAKSPTYSYAPIDPCSRDCGIEVGRERAHSAAFIDLETRGSFPTRLFCRCRMHSDGGSRAVASALLPAIRAAREQQCATGSNRLWRGDCAAGAPA